MIVVQSVEKFQLFLWTWSFLIVENKPSACLSLGVRIWSTVAYPISLRSFLLLSYPLCNGKASDLFFSVCPNKILYASLISPIRATMLSPSHVPWFLKLNNNYLVTITNYKAPRYIIFFHYPIRFLPCSLIQNVQLTAEPSQHLQTRSLLHCYAQTND